MELSKEIQSSSLKKSQKNCYKVLWIHYALKPYNHSCQQEHYAPHPQEIDAPNLPPPLPPILQKKPRT